MILALDHETSHDPLRVGAKAALLSRARASGLPVAPGVVVEASASRHHMSLGQSELVARGSGGARLAIAAEPLEFSAELVDRASALGERLVARSSTTLEDRPEYAGAFSSYLDVAPDELPKAVTGCWASAFTVTALQLLDRAGIAPESLEMAVLIQPEIDSMAGGTATVEDDGTVVVVGVKGSPAPLLQGWSTGHGARRKPGGTWVGPDLIDLVGVAALDSLAEALLRARDSLSVDRCEWGWDDQVWLLQVGRTPPAKRPLASPATDDLTHPSLIAVARAAMIAPGRLGEELVLPWALGGLPSVPEGPDDTTEGDMSLATSLRDELVAGVWSMSPEGALAAAAGCAAGLLGSDPEKAIGRIHALNRPDSVLASRLLSLVGRLESQSQGTRHGVGRWEPFVAAVTMNLGTRQTGVGAAPGIGAGVRRHIGGPDDVEHFPARSVITVAQPTPNLSALLWDTAGMVSMGGSPAAHVFEAARSLGVPAVCGVEVPPGELITAVDGGRGVVASIPLHGAGDV